MSSTARAELLILFHRNPGLIDTIEGVAGRIGRSEVEISSDVKDFLDIGILESVSIGKRLAVRLNRARDKEIQDSLTSYFKSLKEEMA